VVPKIMIVLINRESGSASDRTNAELQQILQEYGLTADIIETCSDDLTNDIAAMIRKNPDMIIAMGGDGTAACLLDQCHGHNIDVLPLPGGTMNLLHKSLHGEFEDWQDCLVRTLTTGKTRKISCGQVADRFFYVGATFGQLSHLSEVREKIREGSFTEAADELVKTEALDLTTTLEITYKEATGRDARLDATAIGALLIAGNEPAHYRFDIGVMDPGSHFSLAKTALAAIVNDWRKLDDIDFIRTRAFTVFDNERGGIAATLDGEPAELPGLCDVKIKENVVSVRTAK
jgi:diacylglycerol kinase family enzyme